MIEVFVFISVPLIAWIIIIYNLMVRDKIRVQSAWSDINIQLKRRHDLIPKLIDTVKQYTDFESASLTTITELRTQYQSHDHIKKISDAEVALDSELQQLLLLIESYPDLKASQSFINLQHEMKDIEAYIENARRHYNMTVRNFNIRIATFPDVLIARFFRFIPANYFQAEP